MLSAEQDHIDAHIGTYGKQFETCLHLATCTTKNGVLKDKSRATYQVAWRELLRVSSAFYKMTECIVYTWFIILFLNVIEVPGNHAYDIFEKHDTKSKSIQFRATFGALPFFKFSNIVNMWAYFIDKMQALVNIIYQILI